MNHTKLKQKTINTRGIRFSLELKGREVARAYLYIFHNDLHKQPVGYLEDVFVDENLRGQGLGAQIINKVIEEAKRNKCYKIVATSRHSKPKVHKLYERLGFENHGIEFRIDF